MEFHRLDIFVPKGYDFHYKAITESVEYIGKAAYSTIGKRCNVHVSFAGDGQVNDRLREEYRQKHIDLVKYVIQLFDRKCKVVYDDVLPQRK